MDIGDVTRLVGLLLCIFASIHNSDGMYLRSLLCKKYSYGGEIDKRGSLTLSYCNMYCAAREHCAHALFLAPFKCCVYYTTEESFENACKYIKGVKNLANDAGCPERSGPEQASHSQKHHYGITFPTSSTTVSTRPSTTPTPSPTPAAATEGAEAANDTTTAAVMEEQETEPPGPDESADCEEIEWTGYAAEYVDILAKLEAEDSEYYCFDLCVAPRPAKYSWLPAPEPHPIYTSKKCRNLEGMGPYLCAMFLYGQWRSGFPAPGLITTLNLCKIPPPTTDATTAPTEMDTESTEGVTESTVSDVTSAADVTGEDSTGEDAVTDEDTTGDMVTEAGGDVTGDADVTDDAVTEAAEAAAAADVSGATDAPTGDDATAAADDDTTVAGAGDDVTTATP